MPPAPTESGTPPNRTTDAAGYTTPHSSLERILEDKSKEPPNNWDDRHDKASAGRGFKGENFEDYSKVHKRTSTNNRRNFPTHCRPANRKVGSPKRE